MAQAARVAVSSIYKPLQRQQTTFTRHLYDAARTKEDDGFMNRVSLAVLAVCLFLGCMQIAHAQESANPTGTWAVTIEGPQGPMTFDVTLKADGAKLTGTMQGPQGDLPLTGKVDGAKVEFGATLDFGGQQFVLGFSGTIDKDSMKGMVDFGGQGGGPFTAQRKK
jgi:hypothetical protein